MTEKNIFVYKVSCHYIFQILVCFLWKNCNPHPHPTAPSLPLSRQGACQNWDPAKHPVFENLVGGSIPHQHKGTGSTLLNGLSLIRFIFLTSHFWCCRKSNCNLGFWWCSKSPIWSSFTGRLHHFSYKEKLDLQKINLFTFSHFSHYCNLLPSCSQNLWNPKQKRV